MPLIADRNTPQRDAELVPVPMGAGKVIYAGSIVAANATGYAVPGAASTTLTYLGRAEEQVDNSGGGDGAQGILVHRLLAFKFANSGTDPVTQASLGKPCYIEDDQTVAATDGTSTLSAAGIVIGIDSDGVWVQ